MATLRHSFALSLLLLALPVSAATLLVGNKSDHTVDLIDLETGASKATLPTGKAPHEIAVSPDGREAIVTDYGPQGEPGSTLTRVSIVDAKVLGTIDLAPHGRPHGVVYTGRDRVVVTTEESRHLLVVSTAHSKILEAVETAQETSHMVAVTPDGRRAFVANIDSDSVTVVDLEKGEKIRDVATGKGAEGIAVTPDGREVWVANRGADTLVILDSRTLEVLAELSSPGFPIRVAISPDGRRALVSCADSGEVALFDVKARKELRRSPLDFATVPESATRLFGDRFGDSPVPVGIVISPEGSRAWVAATQADVVVEIELETLKVVNLLKAGREPDGMAYSPLGLR